jgi:hypothetical protein
MRSPKRVSVDAQMGPEWTRVSFVAVDGAARGEVLDAFFKSFEDQDYLRGAVVVRSRSDKRVVADVRTLAFVMFMESEGAS